MVVHSLIDNMILIGMEEKGEKESFARAYSGRQTH